MSDPGSFQERLSRSSSWGGGGARLSQDRADEYCRPTGVRNPTQLGRSMGSLLCLSRRAPLATALHAVLPENVVRPNVTRRDARTRDAARPGSADPRLGPRSGAVTVAAGRPEPWDGKT